MPGSGDESEQPFRLCGGHALPKLRQAIISPAFVVRIRIGPFRTLANEAADNHALDRPVQSTRPQVHPAIGKFGHLLHYSITVALGIAECQQDMKYCRRQRKHIKNTPVIGVCFNCRWVFIKC